MSGIEIKALDDGKVISIPLSQTVIGRGPFLEVTDKKVSRNHGVLEVVEEKLYLTPIHANPCFYQKGGKGDIITLVKDQKKCLENGDVVGLLPDKLYYRVFYKNTPNGNIKSEVKSELSQTCDGKPAKSVAPRKTVVSRKPAIVQPPGKKEMAMPLDKKRRLPTWLLQIASSPVAVKQQSPDKNSTPKKVQVEKILSECESEKDEYIYEEEKPKKGRSRGRPRRSDDDDFGSATKKKGRGRPKSKRKADSDEEDYETQSARGHRRRARDSDDDSQNSRPRPARVATQKRGSYVDDFMVPDEMLDIENDDVGYKGRKSDDSDFVAEFDDDSGSDWGSKKKAHKGRVKMATTPAKRTPVRKPRRRKNSDSDEGDAYVPRPTKRRAHLDSDENSEEKTPRKKPGRPKKQKSLDDDDSENWIATKKPMATPEKKPISEEDEPDEKEDDSPTVKVKRQCRKSCIYADKCYRKNPDHFKQFCHPGDESYESDNVEKDDDKSKRRPGRKPRRDTEQKSVLAGDKDDDGEVNTYDYNDSFLDEAVVSESEESFGDPAEDSDWEPEDSENIRSLVKEADSFKKNKKMRKPAKSK